MAQPKVEADGSVLSPCSLHPPTLLLQSALEPERRKRGRGRERPGVHPGKAHNRQCSELEARAREGIKGSRQAMCALGSR